MIGVFAECRVGKVSITEQVDSTILSNQPRKTLRTPLTKA